MELLENRHLLSVTLTVSNPVALEKGTSGTTSGSGDMMFVVTRSGDTTPSVKVDYTTVDGTAKAGTDYTDRKRHAHFRLRRDDADPWPCPILGNTIFNSSSLTFTLALIQRHGARQPFHPLFR